MEALTIRDFTFYYPQRENPALSQVNLSVQQGEFAVLCGASGSGKTTLLRHCKPALAPHGKKQGEILLGGTALEALPARDSAARIGFVQQNPENQMVTDKVWHELAFGMESLGHDTAAIRLRTAEMASFFGIQEWFHMDVHALSGGQKQLLALAGVMAMQPELLILDEPTSQLDPIAASEFLAAVSKLNRELGVTVLLTEHRLEEALPLASRVFVMDQGRIIAAGSAAEVGQRLRENSHGMFAAMPVPMRVWAGVENDLPCPVTVREGRAWLDEMRNENAECRNKEGVPIEDAQRGEMPAVALDEVWFQYDKDGPNILKGLCFKAYAGEITAILGGNGAGKTTALSLMLGLYKPQSGKVHVHRQRIAAVPQNPQTLFVCKSVEEDLLEVLRERQLAKPERKRRMLEAARLCRLEPLLQSHPYDLSGGEQQRAALAKVLLLEPQVLLLDEPTKGLDAQFKQVFAGILQKLAAAGTAVVMVSHDIEFCAEHANRCALFFDGGIVTQGSARAFFSGNSFYTTAANRMARHVLPAAVTAQDVIHALGGKQPEPPEPAPPQDDPPVPPPAPPPPEPRQKKQRRRKPKLPKRSIAAAAMIFLLIPLTIFVGVYFWDGRKYYFISVLVIIEAMLPFFLLFERRKPQARELVVLAVLTALAVAGRSAFFMLPQFKPVAALVIITGAAFGGEAGFLVGALTGFVSNMIFGQGPWTPWQMFAFGLIGFLAGLLFQKGMLPRSRIALCAYGGLSTFIIYGLLMDSSSALMMLQTPTWPALLAMYIQGIPFNLIHALSSVIFLAAAARPMLEKLDRIKIKYGLVEQSAGLVN